MRINIRKKVNGVRMATILPGRMTNLPPVQVRATSKGAFVEGIREVIDRVKTPQPLSSQSPFPG